MKTIAIIGGGAAGLAAAICAARESRACAQGAAGAGACAQGAAGAGAAGEGARVVVFEADERVGRSILATGNGRCNFTNAVITPDVYHNAEFVSQVFDQLETQAPLRGLPPEYANAVQDFFAGIGLEWREEGEGRMYPYANKASSVLDVLRGAAMAFGVEERCGCEIISIDPPASSGGKGSRFTMRLADGSFERADAVIVACGGSVARKLLPNSFTFAYPMAMLGPLETDNKLTKQLDNIRVRGVARLFDSAGTQIASETGEILFRKYGLSGIAVFNLSRFAGIGHEIELDLLPFLSDKPDEGERYALERYDRMSVLAEDGLSCAVFLRGLVLPQVARAVLDAAGFDEFDPLDRADAPAVIEAFRTLRFTCGGLADLRQCQVRRGGFRAVDFDPRTMEARAVPGLFIAGEAFDVDAPCGGYNLHWAWASGMLAGWSAADCACGCAAAASPAPPASPAPLASPAPTASPAAD